MQASEVESFPVIVMNCEVKGLRELPKGYFSQTSNDLQDQNISLMNTLASTKL